MNNANILKIKLIKYRCEAIQIDNLASEFFGNGLTNEEDSGIVEIEFDTSAHKDQFKTSLDGMYLVSK